MAWIRNRRGDRIRNLNSAEVDVAEAFGDSVGTVAAAESEAKSPAATPIEPAGDGEEEEAAVSQWLLALKRELHQQVIAKMDMSALGTMREADLRLEVRRQAEAICLRRKDLLSLDERERLVNEVLDETFGSGPGTLDEGPGDLRHPHQRSQDGLYRKRGRLHRTKVAFHDERHVLQVVQRIVAQMGRRVDETCPMVDARLPDGSRLNAIIKPLALQGPLVSIRRFGAEPLLVKDLLANHSITREMLDFLSACVEGRINILISGGTGSGKTTLLNALSSYIPADERVATIEDAAELQLQQPHVVRMETRPANVEGEGEVTTRDLVRNALRMRPDRIIVGECRGAEALDMLQAMNTGHEGSLTTIHANTPRDALSRLEMMVGMAGFDLPIWVIRKQVASAINVVVQSARLVGGLRKIVKISEVTGMEGDVLSMHDIFEFKQTGLDENRVAQGYFAATGIRPECLKKLQACGVDLPTELFEKRVLKPQGM